MRGVMTVLVSVILFAWSGDCWGQFIEQHEGCKAKPYTFIYDGSKGVTVEIIVTAECSGEGPLVCGTAYVPANMISNGWRMQAMYINEAARGGISGLLYELTVGEETEPEDLTRLNWRICLDLEEAAERGITKEFPLVFYLHKIEGITNILPVEKVVDNFSTGKWRIKIEGDKR